MTEPTITWPDCKTEIKTNESLYVLQCLICIWVLR